VAKTGCGGGGRCMCWGIAKARLLPLLADVCSGFAVHRQLVSWHGNCSSRHACSRGLRASQHMMHTFALQKVHATPWATMDLWYGPPRN
jgi:hypothetical protein